MIANAIMEILTTIIMGIAIATMALLFYELYKYGKQRRCDKK